MSSPNLMGGAEVGGQAGVQCIVDRFDVSSEHGNGFRRAEGAKGESAQAKSVVVDGTAEARGGLNGGPRRQLALAPVAAARRRR